VGNTPSRAKVPGGVYRQGYFTTRFAAAAECVAK